MTRKTRNMLIAGGLCATLCVGGFMAVPEIVARLKVYHIEGTLTWIDYEKREASLEFKHPRSGHVREMTRPIPEECPITLQGRPAALTDLKVGDKITVQGKWNRRTKEVHILAIEVALPQVAQIATEAIAPAMTK